MKWSFHSAWMIILGIIGLAIIVLFIQLTINSDEEYYLLKEITEASMHESLDIAYFRNTGELKIIKEKFVENFYRRFAESTNVNANSYDIKIYNIVESPPKVSIEIISNLGERTIYNSTDNYRVYSELDAILESDY